MQQKMKITHIFKVAYLVNELNRKRKEKAALESARIEERRREGAVFDIVCRFAKIE